MIVWRRSEAAQDPVITPALHFVATLSLRRQECDLTFRELASRTHYSHSHLVRATMMGDRVPSWAVTQALLMACDATEGELKEWYSFWRDSREQQRRYNHEATTQPQVRLAATPYDGPGTARARLTVVSGRGGRSGILERIHHVQNELELSQVLRELIQANGHVTVRELQSRTQIPRSTLAAWLSGTRLPQEPDRILQLAKAIGATKAEQQALVRTVSRLI